MNSELIAEIGKLPVPPGHGGVACVNTMSANCFGDVAILTPCSLYLTSEFVSHEVQLMENGQPFALSAGLFSNIMFCANGTSLLLWGVRHVAVVSFVHLCLGGLGVRAKAQNKHIVANMNILRDCTCLVSDIMQARWYPIGSSHVVILTKSNHIVLWNSRDNNNNYEIIPLDTAERCVSFCFGSGQAWQRFSVFIATSTGNVYLLCPVVPAGMAALPEKYSTELNEWLSSLQAKYSHEFSSDTEYELIESQMENTAFRQFIQFARSFVLALSVGSSAAISSPGTSNEEPWSGWDGKYREYPLALQHLPLEFKPISARSATCCDICCLSVTPPNTQTLESVDNDDHSNTTFSSLMLCWDSGDVTADLLTEVIPHWKFPADSSSGRTSRHQTPQTHAAAGSCVPHVELSDSSDSGDNDSDDDYIFVSGGGQRKANTNTSFSGGATATPVHIGVNTPCTPSSSMTGTSCPLRICPPTSRIAVESRCLADQWAEGSNRGQGSWYLTVDPVRSNCLFVTSPVFGCTYTIYYQWLANIAALPKSKALPSLDSLLSNPSPCFPIFAPTYGSANTDFSHRLIGMTVIFNAKCGHMGLFRSNTGMVHVVNLTVHLHVCLLQSRIMEVKKVSTTSSSGIAPHSLLMEGVTNKLFLKIRESLLNVPSPATLGLSPTETEGVCKDVMTDAADYLELNVLIPLEEVHQRLKFRFDTNKEVLDMQEQMVGDPNLGDKGLVNKVAAAKAKAEAIEKRIAVIQDKLKEQSVTAATILETAMSIKCQISPAEKVLLERILHWRCLVKVYEDRIKELKHRVAGGVSAPVSLPPTPVVSGTSGAAAAGATPVKPPTLVTGGVSNRTGRPTTISGADKWFSKSPSARQPRQPSASGTPVSFLQAHRREQHAGLHPHTTTGQRYSPSPIWQPAVRSHTHNPNPNLSPASRSLQSPMSPVHRMISTPPTGDQSRMSTTSFISPQQSTHKSLSTEQLASPDSSQSFSLYERPLVNMDSDEPRSVSTTVNAEREGISVGLLSKQEQTQCHHSLEEEALELKSAKELAVQLSRRVERLGVLAMSEEYSG